MIVALDLSTGKARRRMRGVLSRFLWRLRTDVFASGHSGPLERLVENLTKVQLEGGGRVLLLVGKNTNFLRMHILEVVDGQRRDIDGDQDLLRMLTLARAHGTVRGKKRNQVNLEEDNTTDNEQ